MKGEISMCGIVGLLAKSSKLRASLGKLATPMIDCMGTRGPDSAGTDWIPGRA